MAKKLSITIDSIINGWQTSENFSGEGQFNFSRGIDPDMSTNQLTTTGAPKMSGIITPNPYSEFSGANVTGTPIAILTNPKNALVYTVLDNGRLISYSSVLGSETLIGTVTGGEAHGAFYYNNYIYITTGTDVSRYGPLDGTPSLANTWWTATAGLTALTDTTYPSRGSVEYPNHWGHVHSDGQAYFLDFKEGQGFLNAIKTSKTTNEGDTDNGSAYNVLDLPFGYLPTDIESYGTDLVISAVQTTDTALAQGPSALFFWDPTDTDSFYRQVDLDEFPLVTAIQNKAGSIYVFSGNRNQGHAVGIYDGAFGVTPIEFFADGYAPFAGGISTYGNRIVWGTSTSEGVTERGVVMALGYKSPRFPAKAIHSIAQSSLADTLPTISAVIYAQQASGINPRLLMGGRDQAPAYNIDSRDTGANQSLIIEFGQFNIGEPFKITKVRIPIAKDLAVNQSVAPKFIFDDRQDSFALTTISTSNFTAGDRNFTYVNQDLLDTKSTVNAQGQHNFIFQLTLSGTSLVSVQLPIRIELETIDD